ncbi:allophanate hydrolase [Roseicyclus mahoneyensis]|jgi:allophanate hydrolase|uniref:Allophanate hydrolase n=1 Tax=Roseicyclus mahoneyensis TaxID=164332 RepID=A0A316H398_9RHOB|nr:allophanate hydrolase [Roseicyclus mahoneyensis]PWK61983.1 allophanate hydrolase [Roseicyclus mahoneyensis]
MTTPLSDLPFTLAALREAYAAGVTPADVMEEVLARLEAVRDPAIFIHLASAQDLAAAAAVLGSFDPDRPLWGIPFAVKDNIDVAGMPTTAACPDFSYHADRDAFVVARLRAAGAVPIGKTNLDQFATGLVGVRSPYGVPRNALDAEIVPGGSSSGSAVVVAHGIVPFALGTDTAGSGRVPAALNGIVGMKPSLGALSASGVVPACRTLDTISIFALTVADAYDVFRAASAFDPADAYSRPLPSAAMPTPAPAPRITAPDASSLVFFGDDVQAADFEATLTTLAEGGARVDRVDFTPFYDVARMLYDGAWIAERYAAIEDMMRNRPDAVHPVTRAIIAKAETQSAVDAFNGFYRLAELRRACAPILDAADMLCVPTIPTFATCAELEADPVTPNSNLGTYTNFVNLLDLCAVAVPTGARSDGRPGGVTLIAHAGQDGAIAAQGQRLTEVRRPMLGATGVQTPDLPNPEPAPLSGGDMALVVCGAHMSGLPLNHELTSRGGRFLKATRTAPCYALYALPGGPPARPGLFRCENELGSSIAVEVWTIPKDAVGDFIAGIPAPLVIGTVELEDGSKVKGFLCEASGKRHAEDISTLGSWRRFLARDTNVIA